MFYFVASRRYKEWEIRLFNDKVKYYSRNEFLQIEKSAFTFSQAMSRDVFFPVSVSTAISRVFIRTCVATNGFEVAIFRRLTLARSSGITLFSRRVAQSRCEKRKGAAAGWREGCKREKGSEGRMSSAGRR